MFISAGIERIMQQNNKIKPTTGNGHMADFKLPGAF
jgi:hypothetical protein